MVMAKYRVVQNYANLRVGDEFSLSDKDVDEIFRRGIAGGLIVKVGDDGVKDKSKAGSERTKQADVNPV